MSNGLPRSWFLIMGIVLAISGMFLFISLSFQGQLEENAVLLGFLVIAAVACILYGTE